MPKKILIADDEPHIRLLLEQTLEDFEDEGVEILTAPNGEEALNRIREEKPNLVFLDVMMPKMNGCVVCAAAKTDLSPDKIYIVILSAKSQELDKIKGEKAGADMYLTKPFNPDLVFETAKKVLDINV